VAVDSLTISGELDLSARIADSGKGATARRLFGQGTLAELGISLTYGTGSGQADKWHLGERTLATVTYDLLDLAGGSLADPLGNALTFTAVKLVLVALETPNGTRVLRVGPQNQSNPWPGPWGGTGATVYKTVTHWDLVAYEPVAGFAVTAGTGDIVPIYNSTGASIDYAILIAGV
jgi:hypothetical protein